MESYASANINFGGCGENLPQWHVPSWHGFSRLIVSFMDSLVQVIRAQILGTAPTPNNPVQLLWLQDDLRVRYVHK